MEDDIAHARRMLVASAADHPVAEFVLTLCTLAMSRVHGRIDELINSGKLALKLLDWAPVHDLPAAPRYRVVAQTNLAVGLVWSGRIAEAEEHLVASISQVAEAEMELPHLNSLAHLALVHAGRGHLRDAEEYAALAARLAERRGWTSEPQIAPAFLALAVIHLHRYELGDAEEYLAQSLSGGPGQMDQAAYLGARLTQIRLHVARGEVHQIFNAIADARVAAEGADSVPEFLARWTAVIEAEAFLLAGDPAGAIDRIGAPAGGVADYDRICLTRAYLALGRPHEAARLLQPLLDEPASALEVRVWAWVLAALIADYRRQDSVAVDAVTRALALAAPERMRLPFIMLGARMATLLRRQQTLAGSDAALATEILAALGAHDGPLESPPPLAEPLTQRELTVLRYLPTMLTNTEIGADLHVTTNTVKAHLKALYRKLGVISRSQAVRRARDLHLL
jgi:LuxR family maltose regulon positive regulatory protein